MPRPLRFQYSGAICHIMAHGDGGKVIFEDDDDRKGLSIGSARFARAMAGGFMSGRCHNEDQLGKTQKRLPNP